MKSYLKRRYGLITTSVLAATVLATGWQSTSVLAENPTTSPTTTVTSNGFNFNATLLDHNGKTVSGKTVSLYDITDGNRTLVQSAVSDQNGIASFSQLPLNRNLSVFVDNVAQGYTTRTSESGQVRSSAFYVDGQGTNTPKYSDKTITISVLNEEGEPLANQKVTLSNPLKEVIGEANTDANGKVIFTDKLLDGVFYTYAVNGQTIDATQPDTSRNVFLRADQILKESPKNTASEAATNLEKTSESKEGNIPQQNQSEAKEKAPEKQVDANGANKKAPGHGEVKKGLPMAGERGSRLFTFIGLSLILGIAGYLLKHKKVKS